MRPAVVGASSRARVAIVVPALIPVGGLERLVLNQAEQFIASGIQVDFVLLNEPNDVSSTVPPGSRSFHLGVRRLRQAVGPIARYLRNERPDAVHAAMWPVTCLTAVAHRLAGVPCRLVVSDHNPLSLQYAGRGALHRAVLRSSVALTYRLASARVAVSAAVAEDLSRLSGLPASLFTVIHNPVPRGSGQPPDAAWSANAWRGWKGKRILTVGRLKAQKNHGLLLGAFARLLEHTDARLMILGVGELADRTRRQIESSGLTGKVIMPGHVPDPMPYYRSADLFVLSSDYEGFGIVLVEALSCGLPVVSTDCPGGPADILEGGKYGRLVEVGDECGLAAAMSEALKTPHDPALLQRRARDFDAGALARRYLSLLLPSRVCDDAIHTPVDPALNLSRKHD